ncbi:hypothetical protein GCM10023214_16190 [Amycolatopsis dongchuanensis]|uniref:Uncharacterized protein n=1 Tax=Amycolatopsis dongchuanensis TaxID=1070866 RepID=A0ABP9Q5C7_9PSEU
MREHAKLAPRFLVQPEEVADRLGRSERFDRHGRDVGVRRGIAERPEPFRGKPVGELPDRPHGVQPVVSDGVHAVAPARADDPFPVGVRGGRRGPGHRPRALPR